MLKPPLTAARTWRVGGGELAEVVKLVNTERLNRSEPNGSYGFKSRPQYKAKERPIAASLFGSDHSLSLMHLTDMPRPFIPQPINTLSFEKIDIDSAFDAS